MAASMTGIGIGEARWGDTAIIAEVRSVNNRFLEVSCRLSPLLAANEREIRELVKETIRRGKLYVTITLQGETENMLGLTVNRGNVAALKALLNDLRKKAGIRDPLTLDHFLKFSEVFEMPNAEREREPLWRETQKALRAALSGLKAMREQEGKAIVGDILGRLRQLDDHVDRIERLTRASLPETHQRLTEKIQTLIRDVTLDANRIQTEIALLSDKMDVTEECVRLRSHQRMFYQTLENEAEVGKKLTFLLQEMNREVNTISAKSNHAEISHAVVVMKEEIEKLREQVQNLE